MFPLSYHRASEAVSDVKKCNYIHGRDDDVSWEATVVSEEGEKV